VIAQHDEVSVEHHNDFPDTSVKEGERLKTISGPYQDEKLAKERGEKLRKMTLKHMSGQE